MTPNRDMRLLEQLYASLKDARVITGFEILGLVYG
jgi:hypothetical protein